MTRQEWIDKCNHWKHKWPVMQPEYLDDANGLNIYAVLDALSTHAPEDTVFMCDAGSAFYMVPQAMRLKKGQRLICSQSQGDMGWALPASIGVAKAGAKNIVCIVGDGSFMSNMQELATIREHSLPIKVVILNNKGYLSIKNTQQKFYGGRVHGVDEKTGVWFPLFSEITDAFCMDYCYADDAERMHRILKRELPHITTAIIELGCTSNQQILPSQGLKDGKQMPLHNMVPFLSDEELAAEMVTT
jgi:acetolactate synthase I/II/III large subunit